MGTFLLILTSIYVGVALYEFFMLFLMGEPFYDCFIDSVQWPVGMYESVRDFFQKNFIDKEGP
jgi:hypothetical protein